MKRLSSFLSALLLFNVCQSVGAAAPDIELVSVGGQPSASGSGGSFTPIWSSDGRYLFFTSTARNLVPNDNLAPYTQIFVRDLVLSNTVLVSVNTSGIGGGNAHSGILSISSNGQFVTFASEATDLVPGDTNSYDDIFMRDMVAGSTRIIKVNTNSLLPVAPGHSTNPRLSPDGRWLAFECKAEVKYITSTNTYTTNFTYIFVNDLHSNTTQLVLTCID